MSTKTRPARPRAAQAPATRRKKTLLLDQDLLDRARRVLRASTETDAISQALERVVRQHRQAENIMRLGEIGPIDESLID